MISCTDSRRLGRIRHVAGTGSSTYCKYRNIKKIGMLLKLIIFKEGIYLVIDLL